MADNNDIYRTGVIGQFNLTFELAWKALQRDIKKCTEQTERQLGHQERFYS